MKRGKKPTLAQRKVINKSVPTPDDWLVRYQEGDKLYLVHKHVRSMTKTLYL